MFESQLKKSLSSGQVQNTFKILHFGVKFCDLAQVSIKYTHEDFSLEIFVLSWK